MNAVLCILTKNTLLRDSDYVAYNHIKQLELFKVLITLLVIIKKLELLLNF